MQRTIELRTVVILPHGSMIASRRRKKLRVLTRGSCCVFDPLDGSSNIDAGVNVGTIFGIYKCAEGGKRGLEDVLKPGKEMVAAGYTM